jgi:C-5 cytosine-specific DNA methylase
MNGSFDIRLRFLTPDELADITGFPKDYRWFGSNKFKTWMIGNAVPILLSKVIIYETKQNYDSRRCETTFRRDPEDPRKLTNWREERIDELRLFDQPEGICKSV